MDIFDSAWLVATVIAATPLVFAAMGELVAERSGVLNVGIEGMMVTGAFGGFVGAEASGNWVVGLAGGLIAGTLVGLLAAALLVWSRADQIVVGIAINLIGLSLTGYLITETYGSATRAMLGRPPLVKVPVLSDIPLVGRALFGQQLVVYLAALLVVGVWWFLTRSAWGLGVRAAGEAPAAADSAGLRVGWTRTAATVLAGACAGVGGAFLSVAQVGAFTQNMTAGRGFLALAAVILGRWRPWGVLGACLLFGAADALQLRLQARGEVPASVWLLAGVALVALLVTSIRTPSRSGSVRGRLAARALIALGASAALVAAVVGPDVTVPTQLWLALPYVLTLFVLGGFVGVARVPSALAVPYERTNA